MFREFVELIKDVEQREIDVVRSRGALALQQTQRNALKNEIMEALRLGLDSLGEEMGVDFYETNDGIVMEINNNHVKNRVKSMKDANDGDSEGYISVEFNLKIKNLDYQADVEEMIFQAEREEREAKVKAKEEAKRRKIENDAEVRASQARLREIKLAELLARNKESNE